MFLLFRICHRTRPICASILWNIYLAQLWQNFRFQWYLLLTWYLSHFRALSEPNLFLFLACFNAQHYLLNYILNLLVIIDSIYSNHENKGEIWLTHHPRCFFVFDCISSIRRMASPPHSDANHLLWGVPLQNWLLVAVL